MPDLTPVAVEAELRRLCHSLEDRTEELAKLAHEAAAAEVAHKRAAAEAAIALVSESSQKMTVDEREARVLRATADLYESRKFTEAARDAALEGCRSLRTQIAAVQSVNANLREQARA